MFFHRHRRSVYPLAIAVLTLVLGGLMFLTLAPSESGRSTSVPSPTPAVTEAEYREDAVAVLRPFLASYRSDETDGAKLIAAEDALTALSAVTVPVTYKDVHFGLAVSLTLIRDGLRGDAGTRAAGDAKLSELLAAYPWLAE